MRRGQAEYSHARQSSQDKAANASLGSDEGSVGRSTRSDGNRVTILGQNGLQSGPGQGFLVSR
jgi:hypothetical protein